MNGARQHQSTPWVVIVAILFFLGFGFLRGGAQLILDIEWWKELDQIDTFWSKIYYTWVPVFAVWCVAFLAFWIAHARGLKGAGSGLREHPGYAKISSLVILIFSYIISNAVVDNWTAVLYIGGRKAAALANSWQDPVFHHPLSFYLFDLPFYQQLLGVVLTLSFFTAAVHLGTLVAWKARDGAPKLTPEGNIEFRSLNLDLSNLLHSRFIRLIVVIFLVALAVDRYLDRYEFLTNNHTFMVGIDYVDETLRLPLRFLSIVGLMAATGLVLMHKWKLSAVVIVLPLLVEFIVPAVVQALYVRPNEISIQKPYIQRHIEATRVAFGLDKRTKEVEFKSRLDRRIDPERHKPLLDNVRLWDWRAFHDTVTQIQALRPYYVFKDTDVDRYMIDGELRQVLLTPRELDVTQLSGDARSRWMNPHFIYTHGYGLVLAEANRITADGLPQLFIQNAPAEVKTKSLSLTRPELYYGEIVHEPIFVRTAQPEFNYPSGADNVHTRYEGRGGFPMSSIAMRITAAVAYTDWNILLTGFLTPESRMMVRRNVRDRVKELAGFLSWDVDPYLVLTKSGRMVWMIDGYTHSNAHPYSQSVMLREAGRVNYMRNAVKATVDAYDGDVKIYIFDKTDPIIEAYANLFPKLLHDSSEMPADLREHVRYPEVLFRVQAEIYRTFHMSNSESFYNKEDAWDFARFLSSSEGAEGSPQAYSPTYVVATLPGETKPEFLLMIPFTPRNKDNLIGFMAARCDGDKLGEILFLQLSKQELIFGPLQIDARINQDQNISKDLSLWNQQGSRVVRGQMLVLPVEDTFMYVEPLYIQAKEARMPQLKKVVIAVGNSLVYSDTYEQAIAQLTGMRPATPAPTVGAPASTNSPAPLPDTVAQKMAEIRRHILRYRELTGQGKFVEAAKELEALEAVTKP